jgi:hypothetical protein
MNNNASLGGLLALISNPAVLTVVGIGAVALTILEMFSDEEDDQNDGSEAVPHGSTPFAEPLKSEDLAVPATVIEPYETVELTAEEAVFSREEGLFVPESVDDFASDPQLDETVSEEVAKKEMIRQAMSELGKRSAAARAKKKVDELRHSGSLAKQT